MLVTASGDAYKAAKEMDNWEYINPSEVSICTWTQLCYSKGADMDGELMHLSMRSSAKSI